MVNLILIGAVIVVLFIFFKAKDFKHRFYTILVIILLVFFYSTFSNVVSDKKVDLKTFDGLTTAGKLYFSWLGHFAGNIRAVSGNAIKMDWAGNSTKLK